MRSRKAVSDKFNLHRHCTRVKSPEQQNRTTIIGLLKWIRAIDPHNKTEGFTTSAQKCLFQFSFYVCPSCCSSTEFCTLHQSLPSPPAFVTYQQRCKHLKMLGVCQSDGNLSIYYSCHCEQKLASCDFDSRNLPFLFSWKEKSEYSSFYGFGINVTF